MLRQHADLKLTIEGHTDNVGHGGGQSGAERPARGGGAAVSDLALPDRRRPAVQQGLRRHETRRIQRHARRPPAEPPRRTGQELSPTPPGGNLSMTFIRRKAARAAARRCVLRAGRAAGQGAGRGPARRTRHALDARRRTVGACHRLARGAPGGVHRRRRDRGAASRRPGHRETRRATRCRSSAWPGTRSFSPTARRSPRGPCTA